MAGHCLVLWRRPLISRGWPPTGLAGIAAAILIVTAVVKWPRAAIYRRQYADATWRASRAVDATTRDSSETQRCIVERLLAVDVPERMTMKSQEIVALLQESINTSNDRSVSLARRMVAVAVIGLRLGELSEDVSGHCDTVGERKYSASVSAMLAAIARDQDETRQVSARILRELISEHQRLQPPASLSAQNKLLPGALDEQHTALVQLAAAAQQPDVEGVERAAAVYQTAADRYAACLAEIDIYTFRPLGVTRPRLGRIQRVSKRS
jgi:hypothetical protein